MNRIWGLIVLLIASYVTWVACNTRPVPGQPQTLILLSLAIGYLYKSAAPVWKSLLAALENEFDKPHYVA